MTELTEPLSHRYSLPLEPLEILRRAASMGRTLVGVRNGGALLERIGRFDGVTQSDGWIRAETEHHATRIETGRITAIVTDRSETPHDTILAYVDFLGADGNSLVKVTALDGIETLDAALDGFARSPLSYAPPLPRSSVAVDAEDPGALPLRAAAESGLPVTLSLTRPGAFLSRRGPITRLHFGHNYINVLEEDVHLHLRGRQVSGWQTTTEGGQSRWQAIDTNGEPYGLVVEGAAEAFAALQSA